MQEQEPQELQNSSKSSGSNGSEALCSPSVGAELGERCCLASSVRFGGVGASVAAVEQRVEEAASLLALRKQFRGLLSPGAASAGAADFAAAPSPAEVPPAAAEEEGEQLGALGLYGLGSVAALARVSSSSSASDHAANWRQLREQLAVLDRDILSLGRPDLGFEAQERRFLESSEDRSLSETLQSLQRDVRDLDEASLRFS